MESTPEQPLPPAEAPPALTRRTFFGAAGAVALTAGATSEATAQASARPRPLDRPTLLYPHDSQTRATRDLSGVWELRADPERIGERDQWPKGLDDTRPIPVPCSWNELFDDLRNYNGVVWYQTEFYVDPAWIGRRIHLRFGSVAFHARVWLNGKSIGEHEGAHLPFVIDVSEHVDARRSNRLIVRVENDLRLDRVPAIPDTTRVSMHTQHFPQTTYDFFPFSGIHRPVLLFATPEVCIHDVTVRTSLEGRRGRVTVEVETSPGFSGPASVTLFTDRGAEVPPPVNFQVRDSRATVTVDVPNALAWSPSDPHLYDLHVRLEGEPSLDVYRLRIGIRQVQVKGDQLLLNGSPVHLRGFGKHEDFALNGRGLNVPSIVRDYELLGWLGANSFRTSHYPYSEEAMQLADEYGLLVIDETPAVSLVFMDSPEIQQARQKQLRRDIETLVARDKNHPCVILWSVANEPLLKPFHTTDPQPQSAVAVGTKFFAPLFDLFRELDDSRPVCLVSVQGGPAEWLALGDVICTNSYNGWYGLPGRLDEAEKALERDVAALRAKHPGKPILFTEFGADAIAGSHAQPAEMWSEEYQAEMIGMYIRVLSQYPFVIGAHPWAFADFRTAQSIMRIGALNQKGVFTRDRKPKLAAHRLRELWTKKG